MTRRRRRTPGRLLLLASASPRRAALLTAAGCRFRRLRVRHREPRVALPPEAAARALAWHKATRAARSLRRGLVLAADTVVAVGRIRLGKPRSAADAERQLRRLSGRRHRVVTALALLDARTGSGTVAAETARVRMRRLTPETIRRYVQTGEPMDKAGAYAIQGIGRRLVAGYSGDYFAVVGLPLALLARIGRRFGVRVSLTRLRALRRRAAGA